MNRATREICNAGGHDTPITKPSEDLLDSTRLARAILRIVQTTPRGWSTRVGLYGKWGSGKTSVLNLLKGFAESDGAIVLSLSAWSASDPGELVAKLYSALAATLSQESSKPTLKQRTKAAVRGATRLRWLGGLARTGVEEFAPMPPAAVKAATKALTSLADGVFSWGKISDKDLSELLAALAGRRVLVFIDDLDRADPRAIPKALLALRELLDWPGFSFVLAFDRRAIELALGEYSKAFGQDVDGFLHKVIDVPMELPEADERQRRRFAFAALATCCEEMPGEAIDILAPFLPSQPRRIRLVGRMLGALQPALQRFGSSEVDWVGVALFQCLTEASRPAAEWAVNAASTEEGNWILFERDDESRQTKERESAQALRALMPTWTPLAESERVTRLAMALVRHWGAQGEAEIRQWAELGYREPCFTLNELGRLREADLRIGAGRHLKDAIDEAALRGGVDKEEAAEKLLLMSVAAHKAALEEMAGAPHEVEWNARRDAAERSVGFLEALWSQQVDEALAEAATSGRVVAELQSVVGSWVAWTRNEGESSLRSRERALALAATAGCAEPETLYALTDPFWNSDLAVDQAAQDAKRKWHEELRGLLAPKIVKRFIDRFLQPDGLLLAARGEDKLGAWLVESPKSPMHKDPELVGRLQATLRSGTALNEAERAALASNARLFLMQLLRRTRDASWGSSRDLFRVVSPELAPAAWGALTTLQAPFRMRSELRELRAALIEHGVGPGALPVPAWLAIDPGGEQAATGTEPLA